MRKLNKNKTIVKLIGRKNLSDEIKALDIEKALYFVYNVVVKCGESPILGSV